MIIRKLLMGVLVAALVFPSMLTTSARAQDEEEMEEEEIVEVEEIDEEEVDEEEVDEAEAKKAPEMDALTRKLVETWVGRAYSLGAAGVKKASCTIKLNAGGMGQQVDADASYKWNGKSGAVEFADPTKRAMLGSAVTSDQIDVFFDSSKMLEHFSGCKLSAKAPAEGEKDTVVSVSGANKKGVKSMTFNADGVLTTVEVEQNGPQGKAQIKVALAYTMVGDKYLRSSETATVDSPAGKLDVATTYTFAKQGEFHLCSKQEMVVSMGGQEFQRVALAFSDWKLNDDVK